MGRIWAIARQTIAEGVRMRIALVFILFIVLLLAGLPFSLRSEDSVTSAVQTFLSFSLGGLDFTLCLLAIFLSRSMSEEVVSGQIMILMTKPIPRWQFVAGKWLGIVLVCGALLAFAGGGIYGVSSVMASLPPRDHEDRARLRDEVMTARHAVRCTPPDFAADVERLFNARLETGGYEEAVQFDGAAQAAEKDRLGKDVEQRWRTVLPTESREFRFENVRCERRADRPVQIRYKAEVWSYPPDEILRVDWFVGNPDQGTQTYRIPRRDVIGRFHSISVPADSVGPDHTLHVALVNRNPYEGEPQYENTISFSSLEDIEVLFQVGTFGGNLIRQLSLMMCKIMLLAAFALMTTCVFSFPVACLVSFSFLALTSMSGFLTDAVIFFEDKGLYGMLKGTIAFLYKVVFFLVPDFSRYDGTSLLVNGRNVTLMWVLTGIRDLVLLGTTAVGLVACLLFQRREVAETSV